MLTDRQYNKVIEFAKDNNLKSADFKLVKNKEGKYKVSRINKKKCICIYKDIQNYIDLMYQKNAV